MKDLIRHLIPPSPVILALVLLFSLPNAFSHPLDITYTTLSPKSDAIYAETFIHPYELNLLANSNQIKLHKEKDFSVVAPILLKYFPKHFRVYVNKSQLQLTDYRFSNDAFAEIINDGLYLRFKIPYSADTQIYEFRVNLFTEYFNTQINKIILLDENEKVVSGRPEIFFTKKRQRWELNLAKPDFSADFDSNSDTDKDGLSDHLENLLGTDSLISDTDRDGFTDFQEFQMGWDPLNFRSVKGQRFMYLDQIDAMNSAYKKTHGFSDSARFFRSDEPMVITTDKVTHGVVQKRDIPQTKKPFDNYLNNPMVHFIVNCYQKQQANFGILQLILILGVLFGIGLLHIATFNIPSHSILWSLTDINQRLPNTLKKIFTFTSLHLTDMILGAIFLSLLGNALEWTLWNPLLQFLSSIGFLAFIFFYLIQGIIRFVRNYGHQETISEKFPKEPLTNRKSRIKIWRNSLKPWPLKWVVTLFILSTGRIEIIVSGIVTFGCSIIFSLIYLKIHFHSTVQTGKNAYNTHNRITILFASIMMFILAISYFFPTIF